MKGDLCGKDGISPPGVNRIVCFVCGSIAYRVKACPTNEGLPPETVEWRKPKCCKCSRKEHTGRQCPVKR